VLGLRRRDAGEKVRGALLGNASALERSRGGLVDRVALGLDRCALRVVLGRHTRQLATQLVLVCRELAVQHARAVAQRFGVDRLLLGARGGHRGRCRVSSGGAFVGRLLLGSGLALRLSLGVHLCQLGLHLGKARAQA